ncbi:hypothetical protein PO909_011161 [Leuciscus waleckii]
MVVCWAFWSRWISRNSSLLRSTRCFFQHSSALYGGESLQQPPTLPILRLCYVTCVNAVDLAVTAHGRCASAECYES